MTAIHSVLTIDTTIELLRELATNDEFREIYSHSPAVALRKMGISEVTIDNMPASCLAPAVLASKGEFQEAYELALSRGIERTQSMAIPQLRLQLTPRLARHGSSIASAGTF